MGVPKLENGFTRIANELFEEIIRFNFSKRESKIVLAVIRKTYGYNKKRDDISLSQLSKLTGLDKANVSKAVVNLTTLNVLKVCEGKYGQNIELNKKYSQWVVKTTTHNKGVVKTTMEGSQINNDKVVEITTTKDNSKKQLTKEIYINPLPEPHIEKPVIKEQESDGVKRFVKPTIEEIKQYCDDRKNNIDPEKFFYHYEANGWMVGRGNKMKKWKASVITWEKNAFNNREEYNGPLVPMYNPAPSAGDEMY